jgi:glutathione S-transferase
MDARAAAANTVLMETLRLVAIPFACSLASHIALREAGLSHRIEWVRRRSGAGDVDPALARVNPKATVSTLVLEDGTVLTENVAVLLCIAERGGPLALPAEGVARWRLYEALSFVATEIHKQVLTPFFDPTTPEGVRAHVVKRLPAVLAHAERGLGQQAYLLGDLPTVADAYLFWSLLLAPMLGQKLDAFPALAGYRRRLMQREAFTTAVALEREAFGNQEGPTS